VRQALAASGHPDKAALASDENATVIEEISVPVLRGWRFLRFDAVPHAAASFLRDVTPEPGSVYGPGAGPGNPRPDHR
jgi:hypothetical protein